MSSRDEAELRAQRMLEALVNNDELNKLELQGFVRGFNKGKTMNVSLDELFNEVNKQYVDFLRAYHALPLSTLAEMKRTIADLRNVAGLFFLKLMEKG